MRLLTILLAVFLLAEPRVGLCRESAFRIKVDPVAVRSSSDLLLGLQAFVRDQHINLADSELTIHNAAGKVVLKKRAPFGLDKTKPDSNGSLSVGGAPLYKTTLADGDYSADWTIGPKRLATAHFSIGKDPEDLFLEPTTNGFFTCLDVHIFNSGSEPFDILDAVSTAEVMVDSQTFKMRPPAWAGPTAFRPRAAFTYGFTPSQYVQQKIIGRHHYAIRIRGRWSNAVDIECSE